MTASAGERGTGAGVPQGWSKPPRELSLGEGRVDVWWVEAASTGCELARLERSLSERELLRANAFRRREDRERFVARRGILRAILARYAATRPEQLQFETGAFGKPILRQPGRGDPLEFSQTQSEGLSLIAVALSRRLGIDVERERHRGDMKDVVERFFSPYERAALERLPRQRWQRAALATWVRKEAVLKARGVGLSAPLDGFSVSTETRGPACLLDPGPDQADTRWSLCDLDLGPGWLGTLAIEGTGLQVRRWAWTCPATRLGVRL